jgi:hypothetical protein
MQCKDQWPLIGRRVGSLFFSVLMQKHTAEVPLYASASVVNECIFNDSSILNVVENLYNPGLPQDVHGTGKLSTSLRSLIKFAFCT